MKKSILLFSLIGAFAIVFNSCKEATKEEVKKEAIEEVKAESHEGHEHAKEELTAQAVYQCPMDCEEGKTYEAAGACPVCKMDLKEVAQKTMELDHEDGCKCKEAGECKCEDGKCACKKEVAVNAKECKMCEPGACSCKA